MLHNNACKIGKRDTYVHPKYCQLYMSSKSLEKLVSIRFYNLEKAQFLKAP